MNIVIRRAEAADAEKLAACMMSIYTESPDTLFKRSTPPTAESALHLIQHLGSMENSFLLIAEAEDRIVGMLDFSAFKDPQRSHSGMFGMSVVQEFRGKGIGRKLVEALLKEVENTVISRMELQVFSSNTHAIKLYESLGFEHEGRKRRAVRISGDFCDILLMAKLW